MMTIKYSKVLVGLTMTVHLINLVGGFFFISSEQQPTMSVEISDALGGSRNLTTMTMSSKAEQFVLERRLADVYFQFNCSLSLGKELFDISNDFLIKNRSSGVYLQLSSPYGRLSCQIFELGTCARRKVYVGMHTQILSHTQSITN